MSEAWTEDRVRETFVWGREQQSDFAGINNARTEFEQWLAAHDAEVERVTAEKCIAIALTERAEHWIAASNGSFDPRWEQGAIAASEHIVSAIRSTFGLAPDEKGGE